MLSAIAAANDSVIAIAHDEQGPSGLAGTTLTGVALLRRGCRPCRTGWRSTSATRASTPGTARGRPAADQHRPPPPAQAVDAGLISPDEARQHPDRNVITKALGVVDALTPDVWLIPLRPGHGFVVCSDGLSKELADVEIAEALARFQPGGPTPAEVLVELALERGGHDNVSVVVVEVDGAAAVHEASATRDAPVIPEETAPRPNRGDA